MKTVNKKIKRRKTMRRRGGTVQTETYRGKDVSNFDPIKIKASSPVASSGVGESSSNTLGASNAATQPSTKPVRTFFTRTPNTAASPAIPSTVEESSQQTPTLPSAATSPPVATTEHSQTRIADLEAELKKCKDAFEAISAAAQTVIATVRE